MFSEVEKATENPSESLKQTEKCYETKKSESRWAAQTCLMHVPTLVYCFIASTGLCQMA